MVIDEKGAFNAEKASRLKTSALDILGVMLGSGESSILNKKIKEDSGLVTSIYSYNFSARHGGVFVIGGASACRSVSACSG